ncbi:CDP-diacylglycerol--glycerol-3-phosphate 3-phosphatidyltransferase [Stratiformator vulcanicus]|uniref:CDP-diacylglycerol--glycerol-3-phosphate 3-phosphatidyltransferase n=2 Tax=Stratiformator vulcanicus TaxID=2527980 RepID=A0A517R073_9PLAN|nr:CDP-diacylglycerol--glycerol-3-phosphate 3-phosphatidyltransferase [Stratiformator vulcanicus]
MVEPVTEPPEREQADDAARSLSVAAKREWNIPNAITVSRLFAAFVLFGMISLTDAWITSAVLFVVAVATDAIDGYLARRWNQITVTGRILDPFVDKIIVGGAFIFLIERNVGDGPTSGVNALMTVIVIGREMFVTGLRSFVERQGLDFSADNLGKAKMVLQCVAVTVVLLSMSPTFRQWPQFVLMRDVLLWATVAVTAYSGVAYTVRAVRVMRAG